MTTACGRRRWLTSIALAAIAVIPAGCAADAGSTGTSTGSETISVAYTQPLETLDPIDSDENQVNTIDNVLYDTLVTYNSSNELAGELATSFALTPDASQVKITLRSGVRFHDGSTLTANDVKYSFDRYVAIGQDVASELADYKSATVIDATHLLINLKEPDSTFLANLSKLYILEEKLVTAHAGTDNGQTWLQTHDAGSGPYAVASGTVPVRLTRFAKFWGYSSARPAALVFQQISEDSTKVAELKNGQLDIALDLQTADAKSLAGTSGITLDWLQVPNTAYIFMNTQYGATKSLAVREAVRLAYDYSGGFSEIRGGEGEIENGPLPQTLSCEITTPAFKQNLAEAKSILAKAGDSHLTLTLRFQPSISDQVREATLLQSDLGSIGVPLKLVPITYPEYLSNLSHPSSIPELTLVQDTAGTPDAGVYLDQAYDSTAIGSTNRAAYSNAAVDKLLGKAQTSVSENSQCSLYKQAETLINADAPSISMYTLWAPVAYRTGVVTGVTASKIVYPMSLRDIRVK